MANIIKNKNENNDNLIENKETFALNKINYIIMAIAVVVIIIGFAPFSFFDVFLEKKEVWV